MSEQSLWQDLKHRRMTPKIRRFYACLVVVNILCAAFGAVGWISLLNITVAVLLGRVVLFQPSDHRVLSDTTRKSLR